MYISQHISIAIKLINLLITIVATFLWHYSGIMVSVMATQITGVLFHQVLVQAQIKETSKLRVTYLCEGNPPVTGGFHLTKG